MSDSTLAEGDQCPTDRPIEEPKNNRPTRSNLYSDCCPAPVNGSSHLLTPVPLGVAETAASCFGCFHPVPVKR